MVVPLKFPICMYSKLRIIFLRAPSPFWLTSTKNNRITVQIRTTHTKWAVSAQKNRRTVSPPRHQSDNADFTMFCGLFYSLLPASRLQLSLWGPKTIRITRRFIRMESTRGVIFADRKNKTTFMGTLKNGPGDCWAISRSGTRWLKHETSKNRWNPIFGMFFV